MESDPTNFWGQVSLQKYVIFVRRNIGAHDAGHRRYIGRCVTANLSDWEAEGECSVWYWPCMTVIPGPA